MDSVKGKAYFGGYDSDKTTASLTLLKAVLEHLPQHSHYSNSPTYHRLDFKWYSLGYSSRWYFSQAFPYQSGPGLHAWLTSYRSAPVKFRLLNCCGMFYEQQERRRPFQFFWTGSIAEPATAWYFRFGRFYIGGDNPFGRRHYGLGRLRSRLAGKLTDLTCKLFDHKWVNDVQYDEDGTAKPHRWCSRCGEGIQEFHHQYI